MKNNKAQGKKQAFSLPLKKQAQEEMVGFALILIIVSIIIIVFISLTLTKPQTEEVESYKVNSFLQALLQHTTDCEDNLDYLSIQKLIFRCESGGRCLDNRDTCKVLNDTLEDIISDAWRVSEEGGYVLEIISGQDIILSLSKGNKTRSYKGAVQPFSTMQISFRAYS